MEFKFSKESVYVNLSYRNYEESYVRDYLHFSLGERSFCIHPKQLFFYNDVQLRYYYNAVRLKHLLKNPDFLSFIKHSHHSAYQVLSFCIGV